MHDVKRNYYIDFIKFIFSVVIVFYHSWILTEPGARGYFYYGYLAVDFYFIVTGYLMMLSISKKEDYLSLGKDTFVFLKNKLFTILPYILLSYLISVVLLYRNDIFNMQFIFSNSVIGEILQLSSTGTGMTLNTATWYISSMMIALLILYPLARKYKDTYIYIISPIILLFILTLVNCQGIYISNHIGVSFLGQNGLYKAFICLILGNYAFLLADKIKNYKTTTLNKILFTMLETILYCSLLYTFYFGVFGSIMVFAVTFLVVTITFSDKSYTGKIFNNKIFVKLGKFGFVMFLNNTYVRYFIYNKFYYLSYREKLFYYLLAVLLISSLSYVLIDILPKKLRKIYLKAKCKYINKNN